MTISTIEAPRPPNSRGQSMPTYPAACIVRCHARSLLTSATSAREAAKARPRRSSGRLLSSHRRTSLRNASCCSPKSKFMPPSPHDASAIDHERLARDIPRLLGGEKDRRRADVLRLLLASHRHDVGDTLLEHLPRRHALERRVGLRDVGGELLPEVSPQDAGADSV